MYVLINTEIAKLSGHQIDLDKFKKEIVSAFGM